MNRRRFMLCVLSSASLEHPESWIAHPQTSFTSLPLSISLPLSLSLSFFLSFFLSFSLLSFKCVIVEWICSSACCSHSVCRHYFFCPAKIHHRLPIPQALTTALLIGRLTQLFELGDYSEVDVTIGQ